MPLQSMTLLNLLATASDDAATGTNSIASLVFPMILIGGLFYLLLIRPQRTRMRQMEDLRQSIDIGDEVRTVGGIYGTVTGIDDDVMILDVGGGTSLRVARRAVADKLNQDPGDEA